MINLQTEHSVTGWNMTLTGLVLLAAVYVVPLIYRSVRQYGSVSRVTKSDANRMMIGFAVLCFGVAFRIGGWIPWRGMRLAQDTEWVSWWADHSVYWTATGTLLAVVGTSLIMWPALERIAGRGAILLVVGTVASLFALGVLVTEIVALNLTR